MGNFYNNITLKTSDVDRVIGVLEANQCNAYVLPVEEAVVVFDQACDEQIIPLEPLTALLSRELSTSAMAVYDHDDDILGYLLYTNGAKVDAYDSRPGYFEGNDLPPAGGDAGLLSAALGSPASKDAIQAILHPAKLPLLAFEQHTQLVTALGLPKGAVGSGFRYLSDPPERGRGDFATLRKVGSAP